MGIREIIHEIAVESHYCTADARRLRFTLCLMLLAAAFKISGASVESRNQLIKDARSLNGRERGC